MHLYQVLHFLIAYGLSNSLTVMLHVILCKQIPVKLQPFSVYIWVPSSLKSIRRPVLPLEFVCLVVGSILRYKNHSVNYTSRNFWFSSLLLQSELGSVLVI